MSVSSPEEVIRKLFDAINKGDIDTAVALYEPGGSLVAQPGQVETGTAALREALEAFAAIKPTLTLEQEAFVMADGIALSVVKWTLKGSGPDGELIQMEGKSSDVLRQQSDKSWLIAIDNPWGSEILG